MNRLHHTFAAFAIPRFRSFWLLVLLSALPGAVAWTLLFNAAAQIDDGSLSSLSTLSDANSALVLASVALGLFCGVLADRCSRRRLVIGAQYTMAAVLLASGALILLDQITLPLVIALSFALTAASVLLAAARDVWVADLIPKRLLANGIVLAAVGTALSVVAGIVLYTLAVVEWEVDHGWFCLALMLPLLAGLALALRLPRSDHPPQQRIGLLRELCDGIVYLGRTPHLRSLWLFALLIGMCAGGARMLVDYELVSEFLGERVGSLELFIGFGTALVVITLALAGLRSGRRGWPLLLVCAAAVAFGAWFGAATRSADLLPAARHTAATAAGILALIITVLALINARPQYYGRVLSLLGAAYGVGAAVAAAAHLLADIWLPAEVGGKGTLWALGALALAAAVWMFFRWRSVRELPPEPGSAVALIEGTAAPLLFDLSRQAALSHGQRTANDAERLP